MPIPKHSDDRTSANEDNLMGVVLLVVAMIALIGYGLAFEMGVLAEHLH